MKTSFCVDDVLTHWELMTGGSSAVKQLNALLTSFFILRHDVPNDECEDEAIELLSYRDQIDWEKKAFEYLRDRFAMYSLNNGDLRRESPSMIKACEKAVVKVAVLFAAPGPVDLVLLLGNEDAS